MKSLAKKLNLSKHQKRLLSLGVMTIASIYVLFSFLFSDLGFMKHMSMKGEYNRINSDIIRLEEENKKLKKDVEALKTDPDYIEELAREKLGLVKEGEIIYRFQENENGSKK